MVRRTIELPDELDARLRSYVTRLGEDEAAFITRAVQEQLAHEDNAAFAAEVAASVDQGVADADAGRVQDACEAIRQVAEEAGLKLDP